MPAWIPHFGSSGVGRKRNFRSSTLTLRFLSYPLFFAFLEPFLIIIIVIIIAGHLPGVLTSVRNVSTQLEARKIADF